MECANCKLNSKEAEQDEDMYQLFYDNYYCSSCISEAVCEKISGLFELKHYEEIINTIKTIEQLDYLSGFTKYSNDNKDLITIFLASFLLTKVFNRKAAIEFWNKYKEEVFETIIELTIDSFELELSKDDFFEPVESSGLMKLKGSIEYKIINLFVSSLINNAVAPQAMINQEDLDMINDYKLWARFEFKIRECIRNQLIKKYGVHFFKEGKGIPITQEKNLKEVILSRIQRKETKYPWRKNLDPIDQCTIREYLSIIVYNWDFVFKEIFKSRETLNNHFEDIINLRDPFSHPDEISDDIRLRFRGSIEWFRQILGF